jgi:hypothetical protein
MIDGSGGEIQQGANGLAVAIHNRLVEQVLVETDIAAAGHADGNPS